MQRELSYRDLPSLAALGIGVAGLQFPLSVEIRQDSDDGEYSDYLDYFDVSDLADLFNLLTEELTTSLPFRLDLEEIDAGDSMAELEAAQTGLQPLRSHPDSE